MKYLYISGLTELQDEGDEYTYQEDEDYDEPMDEDDEFGNSTNGPRRTSGRRSARNVTGSSNGTDTWSQWRGERRSSRLGAPPEVQLDDFPHKRARTEESTGSISSADFGHDRHSSGTPLGETSSAGATKKHGAASVKPTEIAMEQIGGKKKSKFWFYAVEPIPGSAGQAVMSTTNGTNPLKQDDHTTNGHVGPPDKEDQFPGNSAYGINMDIDRGLEGSLSPAPMSP